MESSLGGLQGLMRSCIWVFGIHRHGDDSNLIFLCLWGSGASSGHSAMQVAVYKRYSCHWWSKILIVVPFWFWQNCELTRLRVFFRNFSLYKQSPLQMSLKLKPFYSNEIKHPRLSPFCTWLPWHLAPNSEMPLTTYIAPASKVLGFVIPSIVATSGLYYTFRSTWPHAPSWNPTWESATLKSFQAFVSLY